MRQRKPNRIQGYDYSQDNLYFITSCVKDWQNCFGEVSSGKMILNNYGEIAHKLWFWLEEQYAYVRSHAFVVMPNHIHGIIEIDRKLSTGGSRPARTEIKIKSLSELMGAYKTAVSKQIHLTGFSDFQWHRSFYDHIIRNFDSFVRIKNYIENNPSNWGNDDLKNL